MQRFCEAKNPLENLWYMYIYIYIYIYVCVCMCMYNIN